jgi:integrase
MNTLREALTHYLHMRRGLGYQMEDAGRQLPRLVGFLEERGSSRITAALALEWSTSSRTAQPAEWARRLGFARAFARYRIATDPDTEIPPLGLLPHRSKRAKPYLYSDDEVRQLLNAALQLRTDWHWSPIYPWAMHLLIGLMATTGLRISEVLKLDVGDVNLHDNVLTIRGAKLGKTRLVPIHATTGQVLADYLRRRAECFPCTTSPSLIVNKKGRRWDQAAVHRTFYAISRHAGLRAPGQSLGPRLHDFRHRFAIRVLTKWYQDGDDPARRLPVLSTFLGHARVADTFWYLSAWPELMSQAMNRLERRWGEPS